MPASAHHGADPGAICTRFRRYTALEAEDERLRPPGADVLSVLHRRRETGRLHGPDGRVVEAEAWVALENFHLEHFAVLGDQRRDDHLTLGALLHGQAGIL